MSKHPADKPVRDFEQSLLADIENFATGAAPDPAPAPRAGQSTFAAATALAYPDLLHADAIGPPADLAAADPTPRNVDGRLIPPQLLPAESPPETDPLVLQAAQMNRWMVRARVFLGALMEWQNHNPQAVPYTFSLDTRRDLGPLHWVKGVLSGGSASVPALTVKLILQGGPPLEFAGRNTEIIAVEECCRGLGIHTERISGKGSSAPGILPKIRVIRAIRAQLEISLLPAALGVLIRARNFAGQPSVQRTVPALALDHVLLEELADDLCGPAWRNAKLQYSD